MDKQMITIDSYGQTMMQHLTFDRWIGQRERCICVASDIHGQIEQLKRLLDYMLKDDVLILTGDSIDRGPDDVFAFLSSLSVVSKQGLTRDSKGRYILFQQGNHEEFLVEYLLEILYTAWNEYTSISDTDHFLDVLDQIPENEWGPVEKYWAISDRFMDSESIWVRYNGGNYTMKHIKNYVKTPKQLLYICRYFKNLAMYSVVTFISEKGNESSSAGEDGSEVSFQLVHAGPGNPLTYKGRRQLLYGVPSPGVKHIENCHCDYLIHGHVNTDVLFPDQIHADHMHIVFDPDTEMPRRIAIDTGCGLDHERGVLSALRLNDLKPLYFAN